MPTFAQSEAGYIHLWDTATINSARLPEVKTVAEYIIANEGIYKHIEAMTGVPWYMIGALHHRESDGDFTTYLGNGEKFDRVTRLEPKGRGPFTSFEEGAVDALVHEGFVKTPPIQWSIERVLFEVEGYNGLGYEKHNINSPYIWGGTNHQQRGKYTADGSFDSNVMDTQLGVAAIIAGIAQIDHSILQSERTTPMPANQTIAPAHPVVTVNPKAEGVTQVAVLAIPGGPNILINLEHGLESILNFLPTIEMFVPQIAIILPFIPLIREGLTMVEDFSAAKGNPSGDIMNVISTHLHSLADELQAAFAKK